MRAATASCGARPDYALIHSRPGKEHEMSGSEEKLSRGLKQRHLTMIAIGGVIGAGLFVGSEVVISNTGPGAFLGYALTGVLIVLVMRMLGEMAAANPQRGRSRTTRARHSADGRDSRSAGCTCTSGSSLSGSRR